MSTRTDWGWFAKDGTPLAVGDAHAEWTCPKRYWARGESYVNPYTGEVEQAENYLTECPVKYTSPKLETCATCGAEFRYP